MGKSKELKTEQINLRLTPSLKAKALKRAQEEHRTLTNYIEHLIEQDVNKE